MAKRRLKIPPNVKCPECGSKNLVGYGKGIRARKEVQLYRCEDCKRIFREGS